MPKIKVNNPKNIIKGTPTRYYFKLHNTSGPKGDKGDTGATGAQGPKGDTGNAATIHVGSTTTLPVGQDATVENVGSQYAAVLNFGIPQGPQGPKGDKGDTGATGATGPQGATGAKGDPGQNATVYIGTTTTGAPGTQASVYNSGTENNAVLNFTIPQGAQGDLGPANTLSIGSVTKGADAGATITGDAPNQTLNLVLPKGDTGPTGPTGPQGPQGVPGVQGVPGKDFSIYKTYASVADMNADAANVPEGEFVMIASTTEDPDNAKLYVKNGEGTFTYLSDLSGAQGIQGPRGEQGVPGPQGIPGPTGPTGPRGSVKSQYVAELPASGDEDTFYLVDKDLESHAESGEYINFETTQTAAAIQSAQLNGNATQTGTPTPDSPQPISVVTGENVVKVVGKNLIPTRNVQRTINGITFTPNSDGSVTADGTATANATYFLNANQSWGVYTIPLKGGETYTINGRDRDGILIQAGVRPIDSGGSATMYPVGTFTPPTDSEAYAYIRISSGTTVNNQTFYVQLEHGSQSTQFEAYSEQDFEINLGKNLFDKSTVTAGYRIGSDGSPFADSSFFLSDYIRVNASAVYAYSRAGSGSNSSAIAFYKSDKTFISRTMPIITNSATSGTVTSPAEAYYARICDTNANLDSAQLELGSQATSFAPYFTPLELAKIGTYQDRIYKEGEKWYAEKQVGKVVLNGTENWSDSWQRVEHTDLIQFYLTKADFIDNYVESNATNTICDHFNCLGNTVYSQRTQCYALNSSATYTLQFKILRTTVANLTAWETWLSAHPTTVYYALATPTTTEITNQSLIDQLEALASATLNQGVNNIFTEIATGNAMPTLELNWAEWEKYNRHNVYIWNDDIDDWQVIVS